MTERARRRVIGYVRVSTTEQADSGLGLAAQEAQIRSHCERNELELLAVVHDDGVSAKDLHRQGLGKVLEAVAQGHADGLVVAKLDRLSRSLHDFVTLMSWCDEAGCALVALDMGIDTSTPSGRLVANVMASVAEWEREVISQRTRDAASVRRERGEVMGRPGVRDTNPELARRINREREGGRTWQAIADGLNNDLVPTVRGGSMWRVSAVQSAAGYLRPPPRKKASSLPEVSRRRKRVTVR